MSQSRSHKKQVQQALNDQNLQTALARAVSAYRKARESAMNGFDFEGVRSQVREVKERSIADIDALFARFKASAEAVNAVVHEARDGDEAAEIIKRLARERGAARIVKSKSMLTEEIELNAKLASAGLRVTETDLGEWIIQLAGEKPSHFTAPAMHKTREQVAELFSKVIGEDIEPDVATLVEVARNELRQAFIDADMGISGANIAIADTGTLVIVANEGNDRLVTTLPPIHVAVVGYEKLVPTLDDAVPILKILSKSGTGQKQTAYVNFITGPSRTTDIEKTLALGVHGPKEVHIIFVDNGRKKLAADPKYREALYCIKCGACLNMCPVYKSVGGHAFGNAYMGGIGAVLTPFLKDLNSAEDTLGICATCGYCKSICPSKIDVPEMVVELRKMLADKNGIPFTGRAGMTLLKHPHLFQQVARMARAFQNPMLDDSGAVRNLPFISELASRRCLPGLSHVFLRDILPERAAGTKDGPKAAFFAGCVMDFIYPQVGEAIWDALKYACAEAVFPHSQSCCGAPAMYMGDQDSARKMAIDNLLALESAGVEHIITGCPTCAVMLKENFPKLLKGTSWERRAMDIGEKVMDFAEFASRHLVMDSSLASELVVTYHEPCHQTRGLNTSRFSKSIIESLGAKYVPLADADECCGFAGSYAAKNPEISDAVLDRKIKNILDTGANVVATDCPGCILQISGKLQKDGHNIRVVHTAQLIAELMKLSTEGK